MFCFGDFRRVTSDAHWMRLTDYLSTDRNHLENSFPDSGYVAVPLLGVRSICAVFSNNLYAVN